MNSTMAPNVRGVGAPGRRTVHSMCGMCAVRCPIEVTVEDGRVTWLQGNPHDKAIGASLCATGSAGLPDLAPYEPKAAPTGDRFNLLFARPATLAHGQSLNNPILNEVAPKQVLWIHPDRAKPLGIADGDEVEINGGGRYSGRLKAKVTPWIHPEAVFMLHGYGATVALATRARGVGVADQRLQHGKLYEFDPAGGGCAMTETIVQIKRSVTGGTKP
jgi:anaerobic selenocysteine-containing dehydrogenase